MDYPLVNRLAEVLYRGSCTEGLDVVQRAGSP